MNRKWLKILFLCIISFFILLFVFHDDFLYHDTIMKITDIQLIQEDTSMNSIGIQEKYRSLKITGILLNTKDKGKRKSVTYEESFSSVITDMYHVGDKVFIENNGIKGLKRDFYVCLMVLTFIITLYIVGEKKGLLSIVSVIINSIIFYVGLLLYFKGINLLLLCFFESILFSVISILIAGGYNKKTIAAILSTVLTSFFVLILLLIVVKMTNYSGINFNELSYLTVPIEHIVIPELFIGILGASMDVAITISSSVSELIEKDPKITSEALYKSSKEIGKDIMSTMSNVLFFTYICAGIPIFILALRNGFSFYNYLSTNFSLEISRFLVGSIGIVLTIPVTTFVAIKLFKEV